MAPSRTTRRSATAATQTPDDLPSQSTSTSVPVRPPTACSHAPPTQPQTRKHSRRKPPPPSPPSTDSTLNSRPPSPSAPADHLTPLSSEVLALILEEVSPSAAPDVGTLFKLLLVSKALLPHVRTHLYRHLRVDTRVKAHSMHRTLHGSANNSMVKIITADVTTMAKTSSQWLGWFLFHSMHSLCGIIGSCRKLVHLTLIFPEQSAPWANSLCQSLTELKLLQTFTKDLEKMEPGEEGPGTREMMSLGFKHKDSFANWSATQFLQPMATLKSLTSLRLCGISSDSSTTPPTPHALKIREIVLLEINITNADFLALIGTSQALRKLTIWRSSLLSKRGLSHVLKKTPNLVELKIGSSWFGAKDDDDAVYPIDTSIHLLPNLRVLQVAGGLVSPAILTHSSTQLDHLLVTCSTSWTPQATHAVLCKMRSEPGPAVARLTLPEMVGAGQGDGVWTSNWIFSIKATCQAKGVELGGMGGREEGSESGSD